jgi:hypothetical protein
MGHFPVNARIRVWHCQTLIAYSAFSLYAVSPQRCQLGGEFGKTIVESTERSRAIVLYNALEDPHFLSSIRKQPRSRIHGASAKKLVEAMLTRLRFKYLRFLSQDTLECVASSRLCHLQLNSFKVTEEVLQV